MKFRWRRIVLIMLPIGVIVLFPIWHRLVDPDFYATVRCVIPEDNGEVIKATDENCWGDASAPEQAGDR